jgi:hypothetical protein
VIDRLLHVGKFVGEGVAEGGGGPVIVDVLDAVGVLVAVGVNVGVEARAGLALVNVNNPAIKAAAIDQANTECSHLRNAIIYAIFVTERHVLLSY